MAVDVLTLNERAYAALREVFPELPPGDCIQSADMHLSIDSAPTFTVTLVGGITRQV